MRARPPVGVRSEAEPRLRPLRRAMTEAALTWGHQTPRNTRASLQQLLGRIDALSAPAHSCGGGRGWGGRAAPSEISECAIAGSSRRRWRRRPSSILPDKGQVTQRSDPRVNSKANGSRGPAGSNRAWGRRRSTPSWRLAKAQPKGRKVTAWTAVFSRNGRAPSCIWEKRTSAACRRGVKRLSARSRRDWRLEAQSPTSRSAPASAIYGEARRGEQRRNRATKQPSELDANAGGRVDRLSHLVAVRQAAIHVRDHMPA